MEVEKRQAVENEDYDKAKVKKLQMDEYRLQVYKELDLNELLEVSGVSIGTLSAGHKFSLLSKILHPPHLFPEKNEVIMESSENFNLPANY